MYMCIYVYIYIIYLKNCQLSICFEKTDIKKQIVLSM